MGNLETSLPKIFCLGNERFLLLAVTPGADQHLSRFYDKFGSFLISADEPANETAIFIIASHPILYDQEFPSWLSNSLQPTWRMFFHAAYLAYQQFVRAQQLTLAKMLSSSDSFIFEWSHVLSTHKKQWKRFVILVIEDEFETSYLKIFTQCLLLTTQSHFSHGGLCIHASVVGRRDMGFLFLGDSGRGKTTVSHLSSLVGYEHLGDDLNFISYENSEYSVMAAPSPSLFKMSHSARSFKLGGIFTLVKDKHNSLVPLTPLLIAQALFDGVMQIPRTRRLSNKDINLAFKVCCMIARQIPGYELHFRKSPDFWELIDEQFPN